MSFTNRQKAVAKAIVAVFEGSKPTGNYSALVVLRDGAGISYGAHQATHASGTLYKVVKKFTEISNSLEARALKTYLPLLAKTGKNAASVKKAAGDDELKRILKTAAKDLKMQYAQDYIIHRNYLEPAIEICDGSGFTSTLALAVIFDSLIHGSYKMIRDRVSGNLGEKAWIKMYCQRRLAWLSTSKANPVLKSTVYRPNTFLKLIENNNWDCLLPIYAHGVKISESDLEKHIAVLEAGEGPEARGNNVQPIVDSKPVPTPIDEEEEYIGEAGGSWEEDDEHEVDDSIQYGEDGQPITVPGVSGDGYPNEPKPGESVPDSPAKEGEPITGGRPTDAPGEVKQIEADKPTGLRAWGTTLVGWGASLGISAASFGGIAGGVTSNPALVNVLIYVGVFALLAALLIWVIYMGVRAYHVRQREKEAFELTKLEMQIKANPALYNVKAVKELTPPQEANNANVVQ